VRGEGEGWFDRLRREMTQRERGRGHRKTRDRKGKRGHPNRMQPKAARKGKKMEWRALSGEKGSWAEEWVGRISKNTKRRQLGQ